MVPISLPSGKVAFVTFEESMDDEFIQNLIAKDDGYEIDNAFDPNLDRIREFKSWEVPDVPDIPEKEVKKIQKEIKKSD